MINRRKPKELRYVDTLRSQRQDSYTPNYSTSLTVAKAAQNGDKFGVSEFGSQGQYLCFSILLLFLSIHKLIILNPNGHGTPNSKPMQCPESSTSKAMLADREMLDVSGFELIRIPRHIWAKQITPYYTQ